MCTLVFLLLFFLWFCKTAVLYPCFLLLKFGSKGFQTVMLLKRKVLYTLKILLCLSERQALLILLYYY